MTGRALAQQKRKNWNELPAKEKYNLDSQAHVSDLAKKYYSGNSKTQEISDHPVFKSGNSPTRNTLMLQAKNRGIKNFRVMNKSELEQVLKPGIGQKEILAVAIVAVDRWKKGSKRCGGI